MRIFLSLLSCYLQLPSIISADSLYQASDPILELDVDTFNSAIYGKKKAHFVEFYSSWCGACIGYAPIFKNFAKHLSTWSPIVQVTVVNCAEDKNLPLCREHAINAFPTLKYFKYLSSGKDDGILYGGNKHELNQMELDVAGLVQADYEKQKPTNWPTFQPVDNTELMTKIWESAGSVQFIGLAIQENPATMAWAIKINFHNDRNVRIVLSRPQHPEAIKHLGTEANNRFIFYARGNPVPLWISPENTKWVDVQEKVMDLIVEVPAVAEPAPINLESVSVEPQAQAPLISHDLNQYQVQLVDLQSTVSYMLYKEIPRREVISGENLKALKQWIHTLMKYIPGTTPIRRLFHRLDEWIQVQEKVTADEWIKKVDEIQQNLGNPLPTEINWMACAGSKSNLRGYTCGLWTLAHTLTVEAYKNEQYNSAFKPVADVLEPFHQFIVLFLSCGECAENFDKETINHELDLVTRPEDVVIWLWRVHNFVNKRLSGSPSDDPKYPKQQFPPKKLCSHCYNETDFLDESKTFEFLKSYYSDIRQDTFKSPPGYKVTEYKNGKLQAVGSRHLNPKFAVHAEKVDKLEAAENRLRKELDASPQRQWRDIEGYDGYYGKNSGRGHLYVIWLSAIGIIIVFIYCKYRRNRSKFWKTFYYHNDFKL